MLITHHVAWEAWHIINFKINTHASLGMLTYDMRKVSERLTKFVPVHKSSICQLIKTKCFQGLFEFLEVQCGAKIQEHVLKMAILAPRWAVLGGFGVMLRHVGSKMATKSAKMSQ